MKDSSEHDEAMEPPIKDSDAADEASPADHMIHDVEASEGQRVEVTSDDREIDLADEEGFPPHDPLELPINAGSAFHHTPEMIYVYDGAETTSHQVLGLIEPGENRFPTDEAVMVAALEACCATGLLRQMPPESEPQADEDDEMPEDEPA